MTSNSYTHSAHEGHGHWYLQRVSAIALAILVVWFAFFVISFTGEHGNYQAVVERLGNVWNSSMMIMLILSIGLHASLGMQVVIEDYIHNTVWHQTAMIGQRLFCVMLTVMGIVAVIKIMAASSQLLLGGH